MLVLTIQIDAMLVTIIITVVQYRSHHLYHLHYQHHDQPSSSINIIDRQHESTSSDLNPAIIVVVFMSIITITIVFLGLNIVMYSKRLGLSRLFDIYFLSL